MMNTIRKTAILFFSGIALAAALSACIPASVESQIGAPTTVTPASDSLSRPTTSSFPTTTSAPVTTLPIVTEPPLTTIPPATTKPVTTEPPLTTIPPVTTKPVTTEPPLTTSAPETPVIPASAYITCWGDSLTAMGGWTSRLQALSGLTVYNGGVGGESSATIAARQGGDPIVVNRIVIPADCTPVVLATKGIEGCLYTASGNKAYPVMQGNGYNVNPVSIAGIRGTLDWTGSSYSDPRGTWTFTRLAPGEEVEITEPTPIQTAYDRAYNSPYLMILFIGTNGGYSSIDQLILQHRQMIDHANPTHVIVLGLSTGTAAERAEYERAMAEAFGDHFISLRQYLSTRALADAKLSPTAEDLLAMIRGEVPPQLLMDSVHYTTACRRVIGEMLYQRLQALGIL